MKDIIDKPNWKSAEIMWVSAFIFYKIDHWKIFEYGRFQVQVNATFAV